MTVTDPTLTAAPALEARDIVKRFDGVHALNGAALSVRPGEIHALLGENGAGKSTLIKVLTGVYPPDAGTLWRNGEEVEFHNVRVANRAGIVALYQELSIVPTISVAENILLGEQIPSRGGVVQWRALRRRAREQLNRLHQKISLNRLAGELSPVQQTMVAFARALATDARVLILDEPTASLTDTEITELFWCSAACATKASRSSTCRIVSRRCSSSATASRSCATARPSSRRTSPTPTSTR